MAEIDAAMKEDDPNYEQKLMRDELREAMKSGKGLEPLLQDTTSFPTVRQDWWQITWFLPLQ